MAMACRLGVPCYGGETSLYPVPAASNINAMVDAKAAADAAAAVAAADAAVTADAEAAVAAEEAAFAADAAAADAADPQAGERQVVNDLGAVNTLWEPRHMTRRMLVAQNAPPRPLAVPDPDDQDVVEGFRALIADMDAQAEACAWDANPMGRVSPPPGSNVLVGEPEFDVAPYGDVQTLCRMLTLETIMKARSPLSPCCVRLCS